MNDTEVRLNAVLDWLEKGRISTEQAAARIRAMPLTEPPGKTDFQEKSDAYSGEDEVPQPGSPFAISDAFADGRIDQEQYAVLAKAAAQAVKARKPVSGA